MFLHNFIFVVLHLRNTVSCSFKYNESFYIIVVKKKSLLSFSSLYYNFMLKKDKMVCCGVPRCTNTVDKNSNIITLDTIILNILQHIQNPDIFNT